MKMIAASLSRPPTNQEGISFVSASIAVHVHTSPAFAGAFFAVAMFFCFAQERASPRIREAGLGSLRPSRGPNISKLGATH